MPERSLQLLHDRPRREWPVRRFRRALRLRNPDAADPGARGASTRRPRPTTSFWAEMDDLWTHYVGRPSPLYFAERLTEHLGGAKIYLKRDELNHTGAHKINNVLGQIILARRMGKTRIIAETGAGQHGVATATVCAKFGLKCVVYMGAHDVERQAPNVFRMSLLGAEVIPVTSRARHAEGRDERRAARLGHQCARHLLLHRHRGRPASLSGDGARFPVDHRQGSPRADAGGRGPSARHADRRHRRRLERDGPVLSRSSTTRRCDIIGVEAGGKGVNDKMEHCASLTGGRPGVLHGNRTYLLQDDDGQILEGLFDLGRPRLSRHRAGTLPGCTTSAGRNMSRSPTPRRWRRSSCAARLEGIIPALEPSHALAHVMKIAPDLPRDHLIVHEHVRARRQGHLHRRQRALGFDMTGA